MRRMWPVWTGVWLAVSAGAFGTMDWILALFVTIIGLTVLVVAVLARDWESHPSYEDRELARARRRAARRARTAPARARDRERWAAHQAQRTSLDTRADLPAPDAG